MLIKKINTLVSSLLVVIGASLIFSTSTATKEIGILNSKPANATSGGRTNSS